MVKYYQSGAMQYIAGCYGESLDWGMIMWKKFLLIITLICISGMLSGCTQVIDLTEDQTRLVAEYAADLLLSYDRGYTDRLKEGEEELEEQNGPSEQIEDTEATTEEETTTQESEQISDDSDTQETLTQGNMTDIAQIASVQDVSIQFRDYEITSQYPTAEDGNGAVQVDAQEGSQLLVLRFDVTALTDQQTSVSLVDQDIDYKLICNGDIAAKPMLTILTNDLSTLETTVVPGQDNDAAVLVFQISDTMKEQLQTMELHVTYNNIENVITIL